MLQPPSATASPLLQRLLCIASQLCPRLGRFAEQVALTLVLSDQAVDRESSGCASAKYNSRNSGAGNSLSASRRDNRIKRRLNSGGKLKGEMASSMVVSSVGTRWAKPDTVRATCEAIGLARSTYYYQSHRSASAIELEQRIVLGLHELRDSRPNDGYRRMTLQLQAE
jgi:hypothetical protein